MEPLGTFWSSFLGSVANRLTDTFHKPKQKLRQKVHVETQQPSTFSPNTRSLKDLEAGPRTRFPAWLTRKPCNRYGAVGGLRILRTKACLLILQSPLSGP